LAAKIAECLINRGINTGMFQSSLSACLQDIFQPLFDQKTVFSVSLSPQNHLPLGIFWSSMKNSPQGPSLNFPNLNEAVKYFVQTSWSQQTFLNQKNKKNNFIEKELLFIEDELCQVEQSMVNEKQLNELLTCGNLLKLYPQLQILEKQPKESSSTTFSPVIQKKFLLKLTLFFPLIKTCSFTFANIGNQKPVTPFSKRKKKNWNSEKNPRKRT
jgi:hypothetical protein